MVVDVQCAVKKGSERTQITLDSSHDLWQRMKKGLGHYAIMLASQILPKKIRAIDCQLRNGQGKNMLQLIRKMPKCDNIFEGKEQRLESNNLVIA